MKLTTQGKEVLKVLKEKIGDDEATAATIKRIHDEKGHVGNIYDVLKELLLEGFVIKTDKSYRISQKGLDILDNKEEKDPSVMSFPEEDVKRWEDYAKSNDVLDKLPEKFNPGILGLKKERLACMLAMISSNDIEGDNNRIHVLFEGEPGTSKTNLIRWPSKYLNLGFFADYDTSKAGLKGGGKGMQYHQGLLADADCNTLAIDELDKMNKSGDQDALLTAMSQGTGTLYRDNVKKGNINQRVRILATCNNRNGIKEALLDRFDLRFFVKNLSDEDKDKFIRKKVQEWGRKKTNLDEEGEDFLKKYLIYAKSIEIKFPEDRSEIAEAMIFAKNSGNLQGAEARRTESVMRICQAIGKLRLHRIVTKEDVDAAMDLIGSERG